MRRPLWQLLFCQIMTFLGGMNNEVTHTLIVIQLNCPKEGFFYLLFHGGYYHPKTPGSNQKCSLQRRQSDAALDCGADFCFLTIQKEWLTKSGAEPAQLASSSMIWDSRSSYWKKKKEKKTCTQMRPNEYSEKSNRGRCPLVTIIIPGRQREGDGWTSLSALITSRWHALQGGKLPDLEQVWNLQLPLFII